MVFLAVWLVARRPVVLVGPPNGGFRGDSDAQRGFGARRAGGGGRTVRPVLLLLLLLLQDVVDNRLYFCNCNDIS